MLVGGALLSDYELAHVHDHLARVEGHIDLIGEHEGTLYDDGVDNSVRAFVDQKGLSSGHLNSVAGPRRRLAAPGDRAAPPADVVEGQVGRHGQIIADLNLQQRLAEVALEASRADYLCVGHAHQGADNVVDVDLDVGLNGAEARTRNRDGITARSAEEFGGQGGHRGGQTLFVGDRAGYVEGLVVHEDSNVAGQVAGRGDFVYLVR